MTLKSAYELALERAGLSEKKEPSPKVKKRLAEITEKYRAKVAEAEILGASRLQEAAAAGDAEKAAAAQAETQDEIRRLRESCEREKKEIRGAS